MLYRQFIAAKEAAELGVRGVRKLMRGLLHNDTPTDKDDIIDSIAPTREQRKGLKELFRQKSIAELVEIYPTWKIDEMEEPGVVSSISIRIEVGDLYDSLSYHSFVSSSIQASWAHSLNLLRELETESGHENPKDTFKDRPTSDIVELFGNTRGKRSIKCKWSLRDFEIGRSLGEGRFGPVFAARTERHSKPVALKVMLKNKILADDESSITSSLDQLKREIDIQSSLSHPNILSMYGYFYSEMSIVFILECCPGVSLYQRYYGKKMPAKKVAKYILDVSKALQYCHGIGIAHRDIKPENLMLGANDSVKIIDFGFAVKVGDVPQTTYCGTFEYMAPEIRLEAGCGYGKEVDNWAVGVLMYELLVDTTSPFKMGEKTTSQIQWRGVTIDCRAQELISGLLQADPTKRLSFDRVLEHSFLSAFVGSP